MRTLLLDLDETLIHVVEYIDSSQCLNSVHDINIVESENHPASRNINFSKTRPFKFFGNGNCLK